MTFLPAQRIANIGYSTTTSCDHLTNTFNVRGKRKGVVIPSKIIHGHYGVFQYQHIFLFPKQQLFVNSIFPTITQLIQLYEVFSKLCSIILTYFCAFIVHSTGDHFNGFPIVFQVIFKFLFQFRFHVNRSRLLLCMCLFVGISLGGGRIRMFWHVCCVLSAGPCLFSVSRRRRSQGRVLVGLWFSVCTTAGNRAVFCSWSTIWMLLHHAAPL